MKKLILSCLIFLIVGIFFLTGNAIAEIGSDIIRQRIKKNQGEIITVDTGLYFFIIKDEYGNETKFLAPVARLEMIKPGDRVQVSYKKTTDGKLKTLGIKKMKEKRKKQCHR